MSLTIKWPSNRGNSDIDIEERRKERNANVIIFPERVIFCDRFSTHRNVRKYRNWKNREKLF